MANAATPFEVSYPEYDSAGFRFMSTCIRELMQAQGGVYSLVSKESVEHIPTYSVQLPDGQFVDSPPNDLSFLITLDNVDIIDGRFDNFIAELNKVAVEQEAEVSKPILADISEVTERSGNVVQGELTFERLIEAIEAVETSFDEDGQHNLSLVVSPAMAEKLREMGPPTPDQQAQLNGVLARKKAEWDARRRNRTLPSKRQ